MGNCCYFAVCSAAEGASAPKGGEGLGISWLAPAYSLLLLLVVVVVVVVSQLGLCPYVKECSGLA